MPPLQKIRPGTLVLHQWLWVLLCFLPVVGGALGPYGEVVLEPLDFGGNLSAGTAVQLRQAEELRQSIAPRRAECHDKRTRKFSREVSPVIGQEVVLPVDFNSGADWRGIPRILVTASKGQFADLSESLRDHILLWWASNPGFTLRYFDEQALRRYMEAHCQIPDCIRAYSMSYQSQREDMFRALYLFQRGGWYFDPETPPGDINTLCDFNEKQDSLVLLRMPRTGSARFNLIGGSGNLFLKAHVYHCIAAILSHPGKPSERARQHLTGQVAFSHTLCEPVLGRRGSFSEPIWKMYSSFCKVNYFFSLRGNISNGDIAETCLEFLEVCNPDAIVKVGRGQLSMHAHHNNKVLGIGPMQVRVVNCKCWWDAIVETNSFHLPDADPHSLRSQGTGPPIPQRPRRRRR